MKLLSMCFVVFFREEVQRPDEVGRVLREKIGIFGNGIPECHNFPIGAPVDIPLCSIFSEDKTVYLNVSRYRVDFVFNLAIGTTRLPRDDYGFYEEYIKKFYDGLYSEELKKYRLNVVRTGIIYSLFVEEQNAFKIVWEKYLKTPYTNGCKDVTIRFNKQKKLNKTDIKLNEVKTIETTWLQVNQDNGMVGKLGIVVKVDVNNVQNNEKILSQKDLLSILKLSSKNLDGDTLREMLE